MNIRSFTLFIVFLFSFTLGAQIAFPDSAAVVNNHVKKASIYFKSWDGKRSLSKQLWYDKEGRVVREQENESSLYYVYAYDKMGRKVSSIQRSHDGTFIQKFTEEYSTQDSTRKLSLYRQPDSTQIAYVYVYDKHGNNIRQEQYNNGVLAYFYTVQFDDYGNVLMSYDSTVANRATTIREKGLLSIHRIYDPKGVLLHAYRYTYDGFGRISQLSDSTGLIKTVYYAIVYDGVTGSGAHVKRDGKWMSVEEEALFRKEHYYIFPEDNLEDADYSLPFPEMVTSHTFTFDSKGNIIRDDLVLRQGATSETYIYEYEYEFF
jgi:hypothetical protein